MNKDEIDHLADQMFDRDLALVMREADRMRSRYRRRRLIHSLMIGVLAGIVLFFIAARLGLFR